MHNNSTITLFFRRLPLGELQKTEKGYSYTSNSANEQELRDLLLAYGYNLWSSSARESAALFPVFMEIIASCSRKDIMQSAAIDPDDSPWQKLIKLSRQKWLTSGFYVEHVDESK